MVLGVNLLFNTLRPKNQEGNFPSRWSNPLGNDKPDDKIDPF